MGKRMIVSVFDKRYFGQYDEKKKDYVLGPVPTNEQLIRPQERNFKNVIVHVDGTMSPQAVSNKIKKEVSNNGGEEGDVLLLRFFGHGRAGRIVIGTGLNASNVGALGSLKYLMDANSGKAEFHGCWGGSAQYIKGHCPELGTMTLAKGQTYDYGYNFLHVASRALHVPAEAGINCQYNDKEHKFEGPVRKVFWLNRIFGSIVPQSVRDFFKQDKIKLPEVSLKKSIEPLSLRTSPFPPQFPASPRDWARDMIRKGGIKLPDVSLRRASQAVTQPSGLPKPYISPFKPPHWAGDLIRKGGIKLPDVSFPKPVQPQPNPFALKPYDIFRESPRPKSDWLSQRKIKLPEVSLKKDFEPLRRSPFPDQFPASPGDLVRDLLRKGGIKLPDVSLRRASQEGTPVSGLPTPYISPFEPPHWAADLMKKGGIKLPDVSLRPKKPF